jgi:hypothetical protein
MSIRLSTSSAVGDVAVVNVRASVPPSTVVRSGMRFATSCTFGRTALPAYSGSVGSSPPDASIHTTRNQPGYRVAWSVVSVRGSGSVGSGSSGVSACVAITAHGPRRLSPASSNRTCVHGLPAALAAGV